MTSTGLPSAVKDFFAATNAADRERFIAAFAPQAVLDDWGHEYAGTEAIAGWNETDNMGVSSHIDALGHEVDDGAYVVSIQVTGDGYNGGGTMTFTMDGDLIRRVVIR